MTKAHLHPKKGVQRESGRQGSPNNTLRSSSQAHHGSNQPTRGPPLQAQRTTGMQNDRHEHKLGTWRKGGPIQTPPRAVPGEPWPQCPAVKPITMSQYQSTAWTEESHWPGLWDILRNAGKGYLGIAQDLLWDVYRRNQRQGRQGKGWIHMI